MQAAARIAQIEERFGDSISTIQVLDADGEMLRLVLYLKDGTNLRVTEKWSDNQLERYAYYWLERDNTLKIGWDNAPHHTKISTHPHHKHVSQQTNISASNEQTLEQVIEWIQKSGS